MLASASRITLFVRNPIRSLSESDFGVIKSRGLDLAGGSLYAILHEELGSVNDDAHGHGGAGLAAGG
jgi:hypothetical protein